MQSARSGAVALALLLSCPSLALADGAHHGGARRGPPPPPPGGQTQTSFAPPSTGRNFAPQHYSAPTPRSFPTTPTPFARGTSGQPLSSMPTLNRSSIPYSAPQGQGRWNGGGMPQGGGNGVVGRSLNSTPLALDPRRNAVALDRLRQGNTQPGLRSVPTFGPAPLAGPSPLGGTTPSPALDRARFGGTPLGQGRSTTSLGDSWATRNGGTIQRAPGTWTGDAGAREALRLRSTTPAPLINRSTPFLNRSAGGLNRSAGGATANGGTFAGRSLTNSVQGPAGSGALHYGGVRSSPLAPTGTTRGVTGPLATSPALLATHTGGVRTRPLSYAYGGGSTWNHYYGYPGYGLGYSPLWYQPYHSCFSGITFGFGYGYGGGCSCESPFISYGGGYYPPADPYYYAPTYPLNGYPTYGAPAGGYYAPNGYPENGTVVVPEGAPAPVAPPEPPATVAPTEPATPEFPEPTPMPEATKPEVPAPDATVPDAPAPDATVPGVGPTDTKALEAAQAARRSIFWEGHEAFLAADYAKALKAFENLVTSDDKDGMAWMGVSNAAFAAGNYPRAAEAVAHAATLGAFPRGYRFDPEPIYQPAGSFTKLLDRTVRDVAAAPQDPAGHLVLAWLYTSLGKRPEAQAEIQQVLTLKPDDETAPVLAVALLPAPKQAAAPAAGQPAPGAPAPVPEGAPAR